MSRNLRRKDHTTNQRNLCLGANLEPRVIKLLASGIFGDHTADEEPKWPRYCLSVCLLASLSLSLSCLGLTYPSSCTKQVHVSLKVNRTFVFSFFLFMSVWLVVFLHISTSRNDKQFFGVEIQFPGDTWPSHALYVWDHFGKVVVLSWFKNLVLFHPFLQMGLTFWFEELDWTLTMA